MFLLWNLRMKISVRGKIFSQIFVGYKVNFRTVATNSVMCTSPPLIRLSFLRDKGIVTFNVKLS